MADLIKQIKEFTQKADFGDEDLLLIQGQGTTYNVKGAAVKKYAEDAAAPQVALAAKQAEAAAAAADRAESAIQHPAIPDPSTGNWQVWDQVSERYQETTLPLRAEGQDFEIRGYYATLADLETAVPNPEKGYAYGIGTAAPYDIYVWDLAHSTWVNNGPITASDSHAEGFQTTAGGNCSHAEGDSTIATPTDYPNLFGSHAEGYKTTASGDWSHAEGDHTTASGSNSHAGGLLGKLVAVDDGTCQADGYCAVGEGGTATASGERTKYRVMERLDSTHVRVMIL